MPYSDTLPRPEEFVASAYDFTELLGSQRKFAENMVEATKPLLGGRQARWARKATPSSIPHTRPAVIPVAPREHGLTFPTAPN